jgi:hypothetical protein
MHGIIIINQMNKINSIRSPSWAADQEIRLFLWNAKVHYCFHKDPPLDIIPSHMDPIKILILYDLSNIYFYLRPDFPNHVLHSGHLTTILNEILISLFSVIYTPQLIFLYLFTLIMASLV